MRKSILGLLFILYFGGVQAQYSWTNITSDFGSLPASMQVFKSVDSIDGHPNVMYYAIADLRDRNLVFTADTTEGRRLTPSGFYQKNNNPLLVVNTSFFTFNTHQNLNVVIRDGKILSYNQHSLAGKGKDTLTYTHPFTGAFGIYKNRMADVAWVYSDSSKKYVYASQLPVAHYRDSVQSPTPAQIQSGSGIRFSAATSTRRPVFSKWRVKTAVGGGPVLVQNGKVQITNNEELKFAGKAISDRHPRTAIGYTDDQKLVVFVCEGRMERAGGLSLTNMAQVLQSIGCTEALNLDGGGSSLMLINGKEVNTPSSNGQQRAVPSVFLIKKSNG